MPDDSPLVIRRRFDTMLRRFESELRRRLIEGVKAGLSIPEIQIEFASILHELNLPRELRSELYDALRRSEKETIKELNLEFVGLRSLADKEPVVKLVHSTLSEFSRYERNIERRILKEVENGIRSGRPRETIASAIETRIGIEGHRARTLARTGLAQVTRVAHIETARGAGIDRFKYLGASAQRPFCKEHLGQIKTADEWSALSNGQGLDVLTSCGGYNCTHRLRAVVG